jgi:hypothetical protein
MVMNKEQYLEYINHFNNKRYDALTNYFTDDITLEYHDSGYGFEKSNTARTLHGPLEFLEHYKSLSAHTREVLERGDFICDRDLLVAELYTEFHTFKDAPEGEGRQWKKGDVRIMTNWVIYTLENGKMKRIRVAHFRDHDPATAKY